MTELSCTVDVPEEWFGLPRDEDPAEFGRRFAGDLAAGLREHRVEVSPDHVTDLAADIGQFARHAQDSGALFAALHLPDPTGPVLALLECLVVDPAEAGLGHDVETLARQLAEPDTAVAWSEVTTVELRSGRAVRCHEITAANPAYDEPARTAVEKVAHYLPIDEANVVVLTTSWTALALTEQLVGMADGIAASLRAG